jgi:hypothetical protein
MCIILLLLDKYLIRILKLQEKLDRKMLKSQCVMNMVYIN